MLEAVDTIIVLYQCNFLPTATNIVAYCGIPFKIWKCSFKRRPQIREAHAPSVGKYGETNALEQPPQDRKHILWKNICAVWSSYNLVVDMLGSLFRIFLVAPMSNEGKNMTLNDFKEVVKQLFLYRSIALPNNKFFLIVHSFSHRKASLIFLTNTFPYYPLPSF